MVVVGNVLGRGNRRRVMVLWKFENSNVTMHDVTQLLPFGSVDRFSTQTAVETAVEMPE